MQINRTALAVMAALAAPVALADTVTVYGHLGMGVEHVEAKGATQYAATSPYSTAANLALSNGQKDIDGRVRVTDSLSYLGFKGQEDLGGGLSAVYQIESAIKPDDGCGYVGCAPSDVSKPASGSATFATRQSFVGLRSSSWGTLQAGRLDMYFDKHVPNELHLLRSGNTSTALAVLGYEYNSGAASSGYLPNLAAIPGVGQSALASLSKFAVPFYNVGTRASNVIQYKSPVIKGFSALVAATAPESKGNWYNDMSCSAATNPNPCNGFAPIAGGLNALTAPVIGTTPGRQTNPQSTEVTLAYFPGWMYASLAYMQVRDPVPLVAGGIIDKAYGIKASLGYQVIQPLRLGLVYERQVNKFNGQFADNIAMLSKAQALVTGDPTAVQTVGDASRDTWVFAASYKFNDAIDAFATFGQANDVKQWTGQKDGESGARYYQVTGMYTFSKRTNIYATYARVENEANAAYNFFINGAVNDQSARQAPFAATPRGADPTSYQIGISHSF